NEFQEWYKGWTEATFKIAHHKALKLIRIQLIVHGFQETFPECTKDIEKEAQELSKEYADIYEIIVPKKSTQIQVIRKYSDKIFSK
ncbi:putative glycosyl protein, partial [Botrytis fragariae]